MLNEWELNERPHEEKRVTNQGSRDNLLRLSGVKTQQVGNRAGLENLNPFAIIFPKASWMNSAAPQNDRVTAVETDLGTLRPGWGPALHCHHMLGSQTS